jgi:hypothetical protein
MDNKKYRIKVFGKEGCNKCHILNQRIDKLLSDEKYAEFEKAYCDVETVTGLVEFAEAECVNPSRIPAMLVTRWDEQLGEYVPVPNPAPGSADKVCKKSKLYHYLGLQTDYSSNGVISPKMIKSVLEQAAAS